MKVVRQSRVLDAHGRPYLMALNAPPYENAGSGRRFRGFGDSGGNVNATLYGSQTTLRNRSRDAYRNRPYVAGGVETLVANGVGTGIRPRTTIKDPSLRRDVQGAFDRWVDESDADGMLSFYGQQVLGFRTTVLGGEALLRFRSRRPEDGLTVPLQLQVLEGDFCPVLKNERAANGDMIRAGIQHDRLGRRRFYLLHREHPGETNPFNPANAVELVPVPASEVLHLYWPIRPGQLRGVPWLASVLLRIHDIDQYEDAEMVRKKTAAMFALFVTRTEGGQRTALEESDEDGTQSQGDDGRPVIDVQPGSATVLYHGEDIKFSAPVDVGQSFEPFLKHQLRAIARGMGLTYEQLTGDLRGVNYSSIRAGVLEFRRWCEMVIHAMLVHQLCRPVWERWVRTAALAGAFSGNASRDLRAFRTHEREMLAARWIPQGWKWVDPAKEVGAHIDAIRGGIESRPDAVAELGEDFEIVDEQNAAANANADRLKLRYDSDGRYPRNGGSAPAAATSDDDDERDATDRDDAQQEAAA